MKKKKPITKAERTNQKRGLARRASHTAKLRKSYAQSAERSLEICKEWQPFDDELWVKLDQVEAQNNSF